MIEKDFNGSLVLTLQGQEASKLIVNDYCVEKDSIEFQMNALNVNLLSTQQRDTSCSPIQFKKFSKVKHQGKYDAFSLPESNQTKDSIHESPLHSRMKFKHETFPELDTSCSDAYPLLSNVISWSPVSSRKSTCSTRNSDIVTLVLDPWVDPDRKSTPDLSSKSGFKLF
jgi:hypothetical protein